MHGVPNHENDFCRNADKVGAAWFRRKNKAERGDWLRSCFQGQHRYINYTLLRMHIDEMKDGPWPA
jgi:hypothetical protein